MKSIVAVLLFVVTVPVLLGQAKPAPQQKPPTRAEPARTEPVKQASPEQAKAMRDDLQQFQLDQMEMQTARDKFSQNDAITKQAIQLVADRTNNDPDVKKASDKMNADRTALLAKIEALRKEQHLDASYAWDFAAGRFVKSQTAERDQPPPAAESAKK